MKRLAPLTLLVVALALLFASAASARVYWTNYSTGKIGRADTDGGNVNQSFLGAGHPFGIAVDGASVYWSDRDTGSIGRAGLDGSNPDQSFVTNLDSPFGVAVDGQYAYWANGGSGGVGLVNLDFPDSANPDAIDSSSPFGVAVDGHGIYWTASGSDSIGRANLDGSGANPSFIAGVGYGDGIAVDSQHIYWVNYGSGTVGRARLDGSGVDNNFITGASSPMGVAVDGQHIYWTNIGTNTIGRASVNGSGVNEYFIGGASAPEGVAVEPVATGSAHPSSESLDFAGEVVGGSGTTKTLTIENTGAGDLQLDAALLTGSGDFSLSSDGCSGATVAPSQSCTVAVRFKPSTAGDHAATLSLPSNDSAGQLDLALSGRGSIPPVAPAVGGFAPAGAPAPAADPVAPGATVPKVTCTVKRHTVTCKVKLAAGGHRLRWRLVRHGRVYRHGVASAGAGTAAIRLSHLNRLPHGRYSLRISGLPHATTIDLR
jgi:streptogramin lyase